MKIIVDFQNEAKRHKTYEEFLTAISVPRKPIREGKVGEYVLIQSDNYGRKSPYDFNLGTPREGKIAKINPKSVSVLVQLRSGTGDAFATFKYPKEAKITEDLTPLIGFNTEKLTEFYNNSRKDV